MSKKPSLEVSWEDPPPSRHGATHQDVADQLRARPGEWALICADGWTTMVTHIKAGKYAAFQPPGSFDATSRRNPGTNHARIYARYLGEPHV